MEMIPLVIKDEKQAREAILSIGADSRGAKIMASKDVFHTFRIDDISSWEANIIKQHLLSLGTDAAINRNALVKRIKTSVLIFGSESQLRKLCDKLKNQPFGLKELSNRLKCYLDNLAKETFNVRARSKIISIKRPLVCGIINVTPDSFSGDGVLTAKNVSTVVLKKVNQMVKTGANMIDVGGESTRPFSKAVKPTEEIKRVVPVIKLLRKRFKKLIISVDTYKYKVAKAAVDAGVDIINDITALRGDRRMASLIKQKRLGCILMHMKGTPLTMQKNPSYKDVVAEISNFFDERIEFCQSKGIKPEQLFLDPGIGFGKRVKDNFVLINNLSSFKKFGLPLFIGLSRKSFIGKTLRRDVKDRLSGTLAATTAALMNGANIVRVHDVKETVEAIKIIKEITKN